jgi:hypothetical protein
MDIVRVASSIEDVVVGTTADGSQEIIVGDCTGVILFVPEGETVVTISLYVSPTSGGTYLPLYDSVSSVVSMTVSAGRAYQIPFAMFPARFMKIVGDKAAVVHLTLKG